ncbi:hypothetical protein INE90_01120 [Bacteroides uniformis]|uniref:helix-turn-helix transcriptional regulator n=1 Tax=Bacteroidaceae TaxID=815 RepID=UPI001B8ABD51|nr:MULTISPECIES: helix-turn-helix transcriptional regulator [Bacteroidaceae]MBT0708792.1 hypothetical protein [Phocaeicola vulgatus]QUT34375.1 hypothetical protein INE90_01120 [Bacteroides uniformis]
MELYDKILSKECINDRFIEAIYLVLKEKLARDKATLAEILKCKPSKFSEILNGRMKAGIDMIACLCESFDISPEWLLLSRGGYFRTSPAPSIFVSEGPGSLEYSQAHQRKIDNNPSPINNVKSETFLALIKDKDQVIREQAEEIGRLKEQIRQMQRCLEKDASGAPSSGLAGVG